MAGPICLLGVGNVLMRDDALGPYVLECLQSRWAFPPEVTVLDAGTPGLDLTFLLEEMDALIAIDAISARGEPGEVRTFRKPDLIARPLPVVMSAHEPPLREALLRLDLAGKGPKDVLLVGAIPSVVATGTGLSDPVRRALPAIEEQVLRELLRLGASVAPRVPAVVPELWWEAPAARG